MFDMNFCVMALFVLMPTVLVAQIAATSPVPDLTWIGQIRDAGLVGASLVAVWALWRSREAQITKTDTVIDKHSVQIAEKDKLIVSMVEHATAAQVAQVETNRELREIIKELTGLQRESIQAKQQLSHSIDLMAGLLEARPCLADKGGGR